MTPLPALALLAAIALVGPAAAQELCGERTVERGDTLSTIAQDVYGSPDAERIFQANRDRLSDPGLIRPGQTLRLPCAEGLAQPEPAAEAPPAAASAAADPDPALAAPVPAPATDPANLPLLVAIGGASAGVPADAAVARAREALALAAPGREIATAPGGWDALAALHPDGDAILALPWIAPDCAGLHRLPARLAALCTRYDRSAALASMPVVWFARRGSDAARAESLSDFQGLRLCRPAGAPEVDLLAAGLAPPRAERLAPEGAQDCLRLVARGEADAAGLIGSDDLSAPPDLVRIPALTATLALHALARKDSVEGRAALAALDRGLASLEEE